MWRFPLMIYTLQIGLISNLNKISDITTFVPYIYSLYRLNITFIPLYVYCSKLLLWMS